MNAFAPLFSRLATLERHRANIKLERKRELRENDPRAEAQFEAAEEFEGKIEDAIDSGASLTSFRFKALRRFAVKKVKALLKASARLPRTEASLEQRCFDARELLFYTSFLMSLAPMNSSLDRLVTCVIDELGAGYVPELETSSPNWRYQENIMARHAELLADYWARGGREPFSAPHRPVSFEEILEKSNERAEAFGKESLMRGTRGWITSLRRPDLDEIAR